MESPAAEVALTTGSTAVTDPLALRSATKQSHRDKTLFENVSGPEAVEPAKAVPAKAVDDQLIDELVGR
ncbi:hypothetical protein ABZ788_39665, partial [Streptomyces tendae]